MPLAVCTSIVLIVLSCAGAEPRQAGDEAPLTDEQILERAGKYVQQYNLDLEVVISDERYKQRLVPRRGNVVTREIQSEMLFMWLAKERVRLSVRNVISVDHRAIPDSKARLDTALRDPAPGTLDRLRRLQQESGRFNLGTIYRTTSDPIVVLQFLHPGNQARFAFTRAGHETVGGVDAWKFSFAELQIPSVVTSNTGDILSRGAVWVRGGDGTVVRTNLQLTTFWSEMSVTVDYQPNSKLQLWVPVRMEERYDQKSGETILCTAIYSNFRRFETTGRVVTPK